MRFEDLVGRVVRNSARPARSARIEEVRVEPEGEDYLVTRFSYGADGANTQAAGLFSQLPTLRGTRDRAAAPPSAIPLAMDGSLGSHPPGVAASERAPEGPIDGEGTARKDTRLQRGRDPRQYFGSRQEGDSAPRRTLLLVRLFGGGW